MNSLHSGLLEEVVEDTEDLERLLDVDRLAESEGDNAKEPEKPVVEVVRAGGRTGKLVVDTVQRYLDNLLMGQVEVADAGKNVRIDGT
jgi:hypothetical protein